MNRIRKQPQVALNSAARALALGACLAAGTAHAAPANDDFANAINLTGTGPGQTGDATSGAQTGTANVDATLQAGEPNPGAANTVWFKWTSPADGNLTVDTFGSTDPDDADWDAILGIYTGSAVDSLTPLDGTPKDTVLPETMTVAATAGTTYYIQLAGYGNGVAANLVVNWFFAEPVYPADILSFGPDALIGEVIDNAAAIDWVLPFGTNLATLAPTFTLSTGATATVGGSPVVSGSTVDFSGGPVVYTVTGKGSTPIVNAYTVTVTLAPNESALTWNIAGGGDWDFVTDNWLGETSQTTRPFANGLNVIFDQTSGGTITIPAVVYPLSTTVSAASGTYTFSGGPIARGALTKDGGGTLLMARANTYGGGTIINNGKLLLEWPGDGVSHTTLGSGPVTLNGGTLHLNRTDLANALTVNGGNLILDNGFGNTWTGPITLNAPNLNITSYYQQHPFSGPISGSGGITLSGLYGGGLALSGTNTYAGPTIITGGTLKFNNPDALPGGDLSISSTGGAKVELNFTGTKSVASLTLGGVLQTATGTYGSPTSDAIFKSGFFSGNGTVKIGDPEFAAYITSFGTNVAGSAAVIGTVEANAAAITWYVPSGTNLASLAPDFVVTAGATCSNQTSGAVPSPGFNAGPVVYNVVSQNTLVTNVYTVTVTVLPTESTLIWDLASGGTWNRTTPNWRGETSGFPTPYFDGVNVIFDNSAGGTITLDGNLSPLSTTVSAAAGTYVFSVAVDGGALTTGSLTKTGAGTLQMAKANSYDGGTIIHSGTLRLEWPGDGVSHTTLGSGPVTLNGGTLYLFRVDLANALTVNGGTLIGENGFGNTWSGPITLNSTLPCNVFYTLRCTNTISGPGGLTKNNGGPLILSGTNTYTGPTTVTAGTLQCDSPDAVAGGDWSVTGGKVNLNYSGTKTIASLTLGGVEQTTPGSYGSVASGATFPDDAFFSGTGTVTLGGDSDYDTWLAEFTFAPGADTTPAGDPDGDGMTNQEEYAFGLNPTLASSANPITAQLDPVTGNFQYTRRATPAATKLTYTVFTSSDLATWATGGATETGFTTAGDIETVTVHVTTPPTDGKLFVRVVATPTP